MTGKATQVEQSEKMRAPHTPGPWKVGSFKNSPNVRDSLAIWPNDAKEGEAGDAICLISPLDNLTEKDEANAFLIAAAPELLEACKAARGMTGHNHWDNTMQYGAGCPLCIEQKRILAVIDAAIAKAEGK